MYNNYGFNPYGRYVPQQPIQQYPTVSENVAVQQNNNFSKLEGKLIENLDMVKTMEVPFDGSLNFFVVSDKSAIATKQIQLDGTSKTIIYKPVEDSDEKTPKYATIEDIKKSINELDFSEIDDLKDEIKNIKKDIKEIKKKKSD